MRRTKIIATLGPATDGIEAQRQLLQAGVDVVRINFSHGDLAKHEERVREVRQAAEEAGRYVAILGDLQGPKIRIQRFRQGSITLAEGQEFVLDTSLAADAGDERS